MSIPVLVMALLALLSLLTDVHSHGYLKTPRSRNWVSNQNGLDWDPQSANMKAATETCGTTNRLGVNPRNYDFLPSGVQNTYTSGQIVDFDIDITAHHKGHFVLKACPISPGQTATQACFDRNPLRFVSGENTSPFPNHPDRASLPPPNPAAHEDGSGRHPQSDSGGRWSYRYKFQLPQGLSGDLVLLQWHYITANSCLPPGYPTTMNPTNLELCVDPLPAEGGFATPTRPEQFWNCAEVTIRPATAPTPTSPTSGGTCGSGNRGNGVCANGQCCSRVSYIGYDS